jgi:hypothetical protein
MDPYGEDSGRGQPAGSIYLDKMSNMGQVMNRSTSIITVTIYEPVKDMSYDLCSKSCYYIESLPQENNCWDEWLYPHLNISNSKFYVCVFT